MLTRRSFLRTSGAALAVLGSAPAWLMRAAAAGAGRGKILIAVFQRGAADGLNIVVPFFEKQYYELRPNLAIPAPTTATGSALDLDGRFALHPVLQPLHDLWREGRLALVHACGSPHSSRSHFDAQEFMECGTAGVKLEQGWLSRALPVIDSGQDSPLRAVAGGSEVPRALRGGRGAVAMSQIELYRFPDSNAAALLEALYASTDNPSLRKQGAATFDAVRDIEWIRKQPYQPAAGAQYVGDFGRQLRQIAQIIKADMGLEVAFADIGKWDHHSNQASQLANVAREFGTSLAAFVRDMGDRMSDIVIVTMSEFGRTAKQNGSAGTDHGHGGVMMALGGQVQGGQVYGTWPGLEPEQLFEGRDLAVTTDFRDVLGELVRGHLGQDPAAVFPGHTPGPPVGLLKS